ncbi:MAG: YtxH domain-containing protein [Pyrinomonadaceae bacterium]
MPDIAGFMLYSGGGLVTIQGLTFGKTIIMQSETELQHRGDADISTRLTYLLIGGGIGAVLALLFAPKSGHELRGDIADVTRKGVDKTRDAATQVGAKAGEYVEATRERASELYNVAADKAGDIAARKGDQVSAAIQAGRQAYTEEKRRSELTGAAPHAASSYYEVERKN